MFIFRRLNFSGKIVSHLYLPLLLFVAFNGVGQKLSGPEKKWALLHPIAAIRVKLISKKCYNIYNDKTIRLQTDSFITGGKLDAFRHAFFMAAFSQKIKASKVKSLGIAHEKGNYNDFLRRRLEETELADSLACEMDLKNNELGIYVGTTFKEIPLEELSAKIISEINQGNAFIMKRNNLKQYVSCTGEVINPEDYKGKWYVPKCLVKSNGASN